MIVVGIIIFALGLAGLLYPERVMGLLGFTVLNTAKASGVLGEVRATYGGLFVVMGVYTLLAALDPAAHRARVMFIGMLWLGACGGRLIGAYVDGNPGLPGWIGVVFELIMGGALVATSFSPPQTAAVMPASSAASPEPPISASS